MVMLTETEVRRAGVRIIREALSAPLAGSSRAGLQAENLWASVKLLRLYLTNGLVTDPIFGNQAARERAERTIRTISHQALIAESQHKAVLALRKRREGKSEAA